MRGQTMFANAAGRPAALANMAWPHMFANARFRGAASQISKAFAPGTNFLSFGTAAGRWLFRRALVIFSEIPIVCFWKFRLANF